MKITFPAMRGRMGTREYYVAMVKLAVVPRLFQFKDWSILPAEHRAQRVLQMSRIPEITRYIVDNPDDYVFSALTASFDGGAVFKPMGHATSEIGELELPLAAQLIINDGQHRRKAIEEALTAVPDIGDHSIAVVLFPCEDLSRLQQMFSDLNRTARTTPKSLNILFNHRDLLGKVTLAVTETVDSFRDKIDKDRVSLPQRSDKLLTLSALYDSTLALLASVIDDNYTDKERQAIEFWQAVSHQLPEWQKVKSGELKASELRANYIHSHAVVLWGIGSAGHSLLVHHPSDWRDILTGLKRIDWRRTNKEWQRIAMSGVEVINRRQNRSDTASFIKQKLGLPLTDAEERSLKAALNPDSVLAELASFANLSK